MIESTGRMRVTQGGREPSLSDAGRKIVGDYVATEIVPGMEMPASEDSVEFAKRDPEGFMEAIEEECYVVVTGQFPPDSQKLHNEFFKKLDEEERRNQD